MTDLSQRIQDRTPSRPPVLDGMDHRRVEDLILTYGQAQYETAARLRIENALLREQVERLAADNRALAIRIEDLEAENRRLSVVADRANDRASRDRERRIVEEQGQTLWLGGLALVALAVVVWAVTVWR